jgi:hypothetical protein
MKPIWTILITVVATAAIVGGGTWYLIDSNAKKDKQTLQTELDTLNQRLADEAATSGTAVTSGASATSGAGTVTTVLEKTVGLYEGVAGTNEWVVYQDNGLGAKTKIFSVPNPSPSNGAAFSADLSPDGTKIVYDDQAADIYEYNLTTQRTTLIKKSVPYDEVNNKIPAGMHTYYSPKYSPDGKKISVNWGAWEISGVGIMDSDGANYQDVRTNGSELIWSPDQSKFLVYSQINEFGGEPAELYIASTDSPQTGKNVIPVGKFANSPYKDVYSASWSPDGKKIALGYRYLEYADEMHSDATKVQNYRAIYVVNSDGTNFQQVTNNQSFSDTPVWYDNDTILYGLSNFYVGENKGVYSIKVDGTSNSLITSDGKTVPNAFEVISLSKDKKMLVYNAGNRKDFGSWNMKDVMIYNFDTKKSTYLGANFIGWIVK